MGGYLRRSILGGTEILLENGWFQAGVSGYYHSAHRGGIEKGPFRHILQLGKLPSGVPGRLTRINDIRGGFVAVFPAWGHGKFSENRSTI